MRRSEYLYVFLGALVIILWFALLIVDDRFGIDFYPLYFAGTRIMAGLSPYGADATAQLADVWKAPFNAAGVAYPLPLLLLVVPLTLLPPLPATVAWMGIGGASVFAALRLAPSWRALALLPFLFLPFHTSVVLGQATLLWFGLAAIMVSGVHERRAWVVGLTSALLLLKPQNGLLFAVAGLVWAAWAERRALWWFLGASAALWGGALLIQPGWIGGWAEHLQLYQRIVQPPSVLPGGLLLIAACWRLPWWSRVAAAQAVLFPVTDAYSALPLLFCWISIGGPLAIGGAAVSWLWWLDGLPDSVEAYWWLLVMPLMLCAVLRTWLLPRIAAARGAVPEMPSGVER